MYSSMNKEKDIRKQIDREIVLLTLGESLDEQPLVDLAIEYATLLPPSAITSKKEAYTLAATHMRSLETKKEQEKAIMLEKQVNKVIRYTMRRNRAGMFELSTRVMKELTDQPFTANPILKRCPCILTRKSEQCKVSPSMCRYNPSLKKSKMRSRMGGSKKYLKRSVSLKRTRA